VCVSILVDRKKEEMLVCVYCENTYEDGTIVCPECNEYKGMLPIEEASEMYDFIENLEEQI